MKRLVPLFALLSALPGCTGEQIEAPHPVLSIEVEDNLAPQAAIFNYAYWSGKCEAPFADQVDDVACNPQRFRLTVTCEGVPCVTEPAGLLTGGVEMADINNLFVVRPQTSGTLTFSATMTHVETGETHQGTSTVLVRDPERLELLCSYEHYDASKKWVTEACPTTMAAFDAESIFAFQVRGVLGNERLFVSPMWTTTGFARDEAELVDQHYVELHPGAPGAHSVRVTYGAFSAEYSVVLQ